MITRKVFYEEGFQSRIYDTGTQKVGQTETRQNQAGL